MCPSGETCSGWEGNTPLLPVLAESTTSWDSPALGSVPSKHVALAEQRCQAQQHRISFSGVEWSLVCQWGVGKGSIICPRWQSELIAKAERGSPGSCPYLGINWNLSDLNLLIVLKDLGFQPHLPPGASLGGGTRGLVKRSFSNKLSSLLWRDEGVIVSGRGSLFLMVRSDFYQEDWNYLGFPGWRHSRSVMYGKI